MSDRIRQGTAYLIAVGMVLAVASAPTVAQTVDDTADEVFEVAGLNSDTVDGLSAAKYTTNRVKRAGKIVATNANGVLPSNIVKPQWRVIQNMPDGFADGVDDRGVTGVRVTRVFGPTTTIPVGEEGSATADCPTGSIVVGGGAYGTSRWIHLVASYPADSNTWKTWATNTHDTQAFSVYVHAVCMSVQPDGALTVSKKGVKPASKRSR